MKVIISDKIYLSGLTPDQAQRIAWGLTFKNRLIVASAIKSSRSVGNVVLTGTIAHAENKA